MRNVPAPSTRYVRLSSLPSSANVLVSYRDGGREITVVMKRYVAVIHGAYESPV